MLMSERTLNFIFSNVIQTFVYFNRLAHIIHRRSYDFISRYDILFQFTSKYKRQNELIDALHKFTENVIRKRRAEFELSTYEKASNFGESKKKALLDILLTSTLDGQPLSNTDIREEIDTFMFEVCS
jgi:cytochrome P450 family 4